MTEPAAIDPTRRLIVTIAALAGSMMVVIDSTIASVALPHMQSTTAASSEQVMWVLTSYMVATAIATPLAGWLASRFGRKLVMLASLAGFTLASMLCGAANDLTTLVGARVLQGISGAALHPLTQSALLAIYPRERHARILAIQGMASMIGPLFGPTLGGWLTDTLSWRWVFFINLPMGVLAFTGLWAMMPRAEAQPGLRFDAFGFTALAMAVAALQLFLDRGEHLDWFDSPEIVLWAVLMALGTWFTVVHTLTARGSFVRAEMFRDWNFTFTCLFGTALGIAAFGPQPLTTFMLQGLMGYSALHAGSLIAISSLSSLLAVVVLSGPLSRLGVRFLMVFGLVLMGVSQVMYANLSLYADEWPVLAAGLVKGAGVGLVYTMLPGITFATLKPELRDEGAAFNALVRNLGMSVGVSLTQILAIRETAWTRARLVEGVRPDNPMLDFAMPGFDLWSHESAARMSGEIARQATMVGYVNAYLIAGIMAFAMIPTVFLVRVRK